MSRYDDSTQNDDSLTDSIRSLELQLEQYKLLYDFAPICYVTLDRDGRILKINLSGTVLLGVSRSVIYGQSFSTFIVEEERYVFLDFMNKVFNDFSGRQQCELRLSRDGRSTAIVKVEALASGSSLECMVAITDITEMRLEEQKFHIVADNTYDWEFWIDPRGSFIYSSPACLKITGHHPAAFLADPALFINIIHPDDKDIFTRHRQQFVKAGLEDEIDFRIIRADGEVCWIAHACRPVYDNLGNFLGTRGSNRDITGRKLAEMIMQARLRISDYMVGRTVDELLTKVLDEAELLTGSCIGFFHFLEPDQVTLSLQAWSHRTLTSICTAEGKGHLYSLDQAGVWCDCIRERKPVVHNNYESLAHRKGLPEGHAPVLRELVIPIFRNNLIVAVLGVGNKLTDYNSQDTENVQKLANLAWDIIELRQVEETLIESERRFRSLFDKMDEGVAIHTFIRDDSQTICDYRIEEVNPAFEVILGLSRKHVIGRSAREIFRQDRPPYLDRFSSAMDEPGGVRFETFFTPLKKRFHVSVLPWEANSFATIFREIPSLSEDAPI
ncbi:MAG TPA: PAS domain S-box protein [Desulfuromonadales bacterium]|nr:PAS domain S-box protein [Desulfuromonadales bacterium]